MTRAHHLSSDEIPDGQIRAYIEDNFVEIQHQAVVNFLDAWRMVTPEDMFRKWMLGRKAHGKPYTKKSIVDPYYEIFEEALDVSNYSLDAMLKREG